MDGRRIARVNKLATTQSKHLFRYPYFVKRGKIHIMYSLSFLAFSKAMKEQAIAERGASCEKCGETDAYLFAHHLLPEQLGGADTMDNLFLACSQCHPPLDKAALKHGKLGNGLHIRDVITDDPELIGHMDKFRKALRRFSR